MVVTDDQGRYVIPDLPAVNYSVFVRGYGLVDSPRMRAKPGQRLDLTAVPAPNAAAAAHYYPAIYWYSMLKMPPESELGGKQIDWLKQMKNIGCIGCHQIGQEATRTIPAQFGAFNSGEEAWMRRLQSGLAGGGDDQRGRVLRRCAFQISRRLDRPPRQRRAAQAAAGAHPATSGSPGQLVLKRTGGCALPTRTFR